MARSQNYCVCLSSSANVCHPAISALLPPAAVHLLPRPCRPENQAQGFTWRNTGGRILEQTNDTRR